MKQEDVFAVIFMVFGLAFFIYVVWQIQLSEEKRYQRRLDEAREFGYQERLNPPIPVKESKHKKS